MAALQHLSLQLAHAQPGRRALSAGASSTRHASIMTTASKRRGSMAVARAEPSSSSDGPSTSGSPITETPKATSSLLERAFRGSPEWPLFLGVLAQSGALTGTLLDGIHSRTGLQVYDVAPLHLGPLQTSALVPVLLGVFYAALGTLTCLSDNLALTSSNTGDMAATSAAQERSLSWEYTALGFGALAAALQLSAYLFADVSAPYWQIHCALAAATAVIWRTLDGTRQGLALGVLCAVAAPLTEIALNAGLHCWHYPRSDMAGLASALGVASQDIPPSWVAWCYLFYQPAVSNLARYLWRFCQPMSSSPSR